MLWDHTSESEVAKACDGIEFGSKPKSAVDSIMKSISSSRNNGEKFEKFVDDRDFLEYGLTLLQYCIPWLVLFVFSLIALYHFLTL